MTWLRRLLSLFGCAHQHTIRERDECGVLWFLCQRCNRRVPAIARTVQERRRMLKQFKPVTISKARSAPADIVPIRKAAK